MEKGTSFWLRPPAFNLTQRETATGVFSDIVLAESDFANPSVGLNSTQVGAPVLERLVLSLGYDQIVNHLYFDPGQFAQVTMLVETLIFTQDDQFTTIVTNTATFDDALENQRVLGYEVAKFHMSTPVFFATADETKPRIQVSCRSDYEPKVRVRLREKAVAVAIRTNMDLANVAIESTFVWTQPTMLVRVP